MSQGSGGSRNCSSISGTTAGAMRLADSIDRRKGLTITQLALRTSWASSALGRWIGWSAASRSPSSQLARSRPDIGVVKSQAGVPCRARMILGRLNSATQAEPRQHYGGQEDDQSLLHELAEYLAVRASEGRPHKPKSVLREGSQELDAPRVLGKGIETTVGEQSHKKSEGDLDPRPTCQRLTEEQKCGDQGSDNSERQRMRNAAMGSESDHIDVGQGGASCRGQAHALGGWRYVMRGPGADGVTNSGMREWCGHRVVRSSMLSYESRRGMEPSCPFTPRSRTKTGSFALAMPQYLMTRLLWPCS